MTLALLEPGDEIVCGWPSFPSYVIDARNKGTGNIPDPDQPVIALQGLKSFIWIAIIIVSEPGELGEPKGR